MRCHARSVQLALLFALAAPSALSGACKTAESSATEPAGGLPDRDPALAHRLVEQENAVILDVRTKEEWDAGHIEGATLIPHSELESRMTEVDKLTEGDKQRPIVVYCKSGGRAGKAKDMLLGAGYQRVTNLGGYTDW